MAARIMRNPDVLWREEDDARDEAQAALEQGDDVSEVGTSLLFANGQMVVLNLLGTEIWKRCDKKSVAELTAELLAEFDVEEAILREDVSGFLAELAEKGFIAYE
ncbi:coenzyme PQQ synthesis protein D [Geobacter sp. OR-1]|uniref:GeoRSP system PqqD family peptide chaperone n=1 Tax=Geobacter sp. OR-1 TaxID=1266765 RepID=UPI000541C865|nr:GeoRSP system PqqD family peptide chaperone [Geobacter sp. OR-1]GAM11304.1 coenzyme PQQ synthesis protein D [Geobacter sp. OR-1]